MEISYSFSYGVQKPTRDRITSLESALKKVPDSMDSDDLGELNEHFFAPQVYGRKMTIPAGLCVVGKIHKHAHLNVISKGVIKVVTEFGEHVYTAPRTWVSEAGTKRAVYALEDTEWLTIHPNPSDTQDISKLEEELIAPSFEAFDRLVIEQGETV